MKQICGISIHCNKKIITKLAKANITPYRIDDDGAHYYKDVPYNQVSFRAESKREYTEEQKEAMGERMKIMHEARRNKLNATND